MLQYNSCCSMLRVVMFQRVVAQCVMHFSEHDFCSMLGTVILYAVEIHSDFESILVFCYMLQYTNSTGWEVMKFHLEISFLFFSVASVNTIHFPCMPQ